MRPTLIPRQNGNQDFAVQQSSFNDLQQNNQNNGSGVHMTNATNYEKYNNSALKASSSIGGSIGSGASIGASIGSLFPGYGTAIGAVIGALGGTLGGILRNKKNKKAQKDAQAHADAERDLQYQRQLQVMDKQQQMQQEYYDRNFSYAAQVRQMKDAGLSVASMYNQGTQGTGGSSVSAPTPQQAENIAPYRSETGTISDSLSQSLQPLLTVANASNALTTAQGNAIDNETKFTSNIADIAKTYAEIDKLVKDGNLSESRAAEIYSLLDSRKRNLESQSALLDVQTSHQGDFMKSQTAANNANANLANETAVNKQGIDKSTIAENYASIGLKNAQTGTEKWRKENERFSTYRNDLAWTTSKNKYLLSRDLCKKIGIDEKYSSTLQDILESASSQVGISLVDVPTRTLFSWFDFGNWKNIFTTKMFTTAQSELQQKMQEWQSDENELNRRNAIDVANTHYASADNVVKRWQDWHDKNGSSKHKEIEKQVISEAQAIYARLSQNDKKKVVDYSLKHPDDPLGVAYFTRELFKNYK